MLKMSVSIKLLSQIFQNLKISEVLKNRQQKYHFKKPFGKILEFSKTGLHVKELCYVYTCTKFQVDILKNDRVLVF